MFDRWEARAGKQRLEIVQRELDRVDERAVGGVIQTVDIPIMMAAQSEIIYFRQLRLTRRLTRAGISIPSQMWTEEPTVQIETPDGVFLRTHETLTQQGEAWAPQELKKRRREDIEFWAKIVLPILSLIISIIALLKTH